MEQNWNGNGAGMELEQNRNGIGMDLEWNGTEMEQNFKGQTMEARLRAPSLYTIV